MHPQRVELCGAPGGSAGHEGSQAPHHPIGAGMQHQAHLVGGGAGTAGAVGSQMGFPVFDMVLRHAPAAIDLFIELLTPPDGQAGDNEAGVHALRPRLDTGDDTLDPTPAAGGIMEFGEATDLVRPRRPCPGAGLQRDDMGPQGGVGGQPEA